MYESAEPINAEYRPETVVNSLLNVKKAHQASLRILSEEICTARNALAEKIRKLKHRAILIARKSVFRKAETEINFLIDSAKTHYEKCIIQSNLDCLNLALSIAKEVLQEEVSVNTKSLATRIKSAADKLVKAESLLITANDKHIPALKDIFKTYPVKIEFRADSDIEPGNAVIKTSTGKISLNWKTQLEIMQNLLINKIRQSLCS